MMLSSPNWSALPKGIDRNANAAAIGESKAPEEILA
jgi:hypothetical protein